MKSVEQIKERIQGLEGDLNYAKQWVEDSQANYNMNNNFWGEPNEDDIAELNDAIATKTSLERGIELLKWTLED